MAKEKPAKKTTKNSAKTSTGDASKGFTAEERAAMRERVKELKASAGKADDEAAVVAKIAAMAAPDRALGQRIHSLIKTSAPELTSKLWYGMPAYARDGQIVCFFQDAQKFKSRYATLGFSDKANLDEGKMWPTSFAVKELTAADEARVVALVRKAVGAA